MKKKQIVRFSRCCVLQCLAACKYFLLSSIKIVGMLIKMKWKHWLYRIINNIYIYLFTLENPFGISCTTQPEGSLLQLRKVGVPEVSLIVSIDTSTTAHTPSPCCLQNLRKFTSRIGTKGESTWSSACIWKTNFLWLKKLWSNCQIYGWFSVQPMSPVQFSS